MTSGTLSRIYNAHGAFVSNSLNGTIKTNRNIMPLLTDDLDFNHNELDVYPGSNEWV